jgi:hypothetical protein
MRPWRVPATAVPFLSLMSSTASGQIRAPVVVSEGGDLSMFDTAADLDGDVEAVDVRAGRYEAFDAHGTRLELTTSGSQVYVVSTGEPAINDFRGLIVRYLARVSDPPDRSDDVGALLERLRPHATNPPPGRLGRWLEARFRWPPSGYKPRGEPWV